MSKPQAPVIMRDAQCNRQGILVTWMAPSNTRAESHTINYKAESWWQPVRVTIPGELDEFLISDVPPNSKVMVSIYSTNQHGSSVWSDEVGFVSSRDCGQEGPVAPDVVSEVDMPAQQMYDLMYTREFDQFAEQLRLVTKIEQLEYEQREGGTHKRVRVTPPCPPKLQQMAESMLGGTIFTYDEVSFKKNDKMEITFEICNLSYLNDYLEVAEGRLEIKPVDESHCRLEGFFDLRVNYPVIGYYVAQVIRQQVISDLTNWGQNAHKYVAQQKQ